MFEKACDLGAIAEGRFITVGIGRTLVLLVWPTGGRLRAFQGLRPHAGQLLSDARFDGAELTCRFHDWVFDGETGICREGRVCRLAEYPLQIRGEEVLVDTEGAQPNLLQP